MNEYRTGVSTAAPVMERASLIHTYGSRSWQASPTFLVFLGVLLFFIVETVAILVLNNFHFVYLLDDAYIHLSVSEQIHHLSYGLNPGEASTPSSSLLWPFLLSVTAGTIFHEITPIVLALVASLVTAWLLLRLLREVVGETKKWISVFAVLVVMVSLNWLGVAFTGLEHSTHVAAALAVGVGLVECARGKPAPWWLFLGIVLNPLIRYEGLAVAGPAIVALLCYGYRRGPVLCAVGCALPLIAFSAIAVRNGLDLLPSSVIAHSHLTSPGASEILAVVKSVWQTTKVPFFTLISAGLLAHTFARGFRGITVLHLYALSVLAAHAIAGQSDDSWGRYTVYVYAAVLPVIVHFAEPTIRSNIRHPEAGRRIAVATIMLVVVTVPYLRVTFETPLGTRNIYLQQYQMARFAADYWSQPVAVNDVGLVGYRDSSYVLDLWGLASQEARKARFAEPGTAWMNRLALEHGVTAAMIYNDPYWFPEVPREWVPVARLSFGMPLISANRKNVTFYATSQEGVSRLRAALAKFQPTLPSGATLTMLASSS